MYRFSTLPNLSVILERKLIIINHLHINTTNAVDPAQFVESNEQLE